MSNISETVERISSQKKKEKRYSGFTMNVRMISMENKERQATISPEKVSSALGGVTAARRSSPNRAKIVIASMKIVQVQWSRKKIVCSYVENTFQPGLGS